MTSSGDESRSGFPRGSLVADPAWAIVAIPAVIWGIPNVEDDLADSGSDALEGAGLEIDFDGRDATITGTGEQATIDAVEDTVYNLRGVRRVDAADTRAAAPAAITTTVVDYLIDGGAAADRLTAVGYGEEQPIADNDTAKGRAQNRRIEFAVDEGERR